jgi:hypothetical protein
MPRKAAAPPVSEGEDAPAPRRSSRISAITKAVEAPIKKVTKPRKKKGAATEAAEEEKVEDESGATEGDKAEAEIPAAPVNGAKRKASEAPDGKPASKKVRF